MFRLHVLDGKLAPGACKDPMVSTMHLHNSLLLVSFSPLLQTHNLPDFPALSCLSLRRSSARIPMPPPTRNATLFPTNQHYPPSSPSLRHLPEVSAACCLTAALSRLKALSAAPLNSAPEEAQRRAAVLRKAGSACEARVAVRRPSMVSSVLWTERRSGEW